jgi:MraZ protein
MAAFTGKYTHSIDHKGRVSLPARFRRAGKSRKYMLLRGMEKNLLLFTSAEWDKMLEEQFSSPYLESEALRAYQRFLGANSSEVVLDKQGRIMIPSHMMDHAALEKEVLVLGAINWIEIWNHEEYRRFEEGHSAKKNAEDVFATINKLKREGG